MEEEDDMGSLQREAEEANNLQGRQFFFDLAGAGPNMNRGPAGGSSSVNQKKVLAKINSGREVLTRSGYIINCI